MKFDHVDVANGECKAINTPRTAEEVYAVRNLGIPADMVRQGILTLDKKEKKKEDRPEVIVEENNTTDSVSVDDLSIEELHKIFEEKEGKTVPVNKKNDINWIKNKIFS